MKQSNMFDDAAGSPLFSVPDTPPVEPAFQTPKEKRHAMLIARSQPQQSHSKENTVIYYEYRVRKLNATETYEHAKQYNEDRLYKMSTVYTFEQQTVWDTEGQRDEKGWTVYDWAESAKKAAIYNDSTYLKAESLHPLHTKTVERITEANRLQKEEQQLTLELNGITDKYSNLYHAALKSRKLYKKAMAGEVAQDIIDSIREPLLQQYREEKETIKSQRDSIDKQLANWWQ
jgi:hypothetical protein